jgi:hypothetical protein
MQIKLFFKSKLVSRKSKLKLYWSVIRPIVIYGCETWVLKESVIQRLSVFERKIIRKIFGPTKEYNGIWRIKTNKKLDELTKQRNIINYVKAERLSWFGHINGMPETNIVKRIYKWKPFTSRSVGREDDVRNDLEKMKLIKWTEQAQDRLKWKVIVEKAKTLIRVEEEEEEGEEGGEEEEEEEEEGQGLLIIEASRSHLDTPQSVGLLWTSDQPDEEPSLNTQHPPETDLYAYDGIRTPQSQQASCRKPTP